MPVLSNARRERFAQLMAEGKNPKEAHGEAGFKAHYGNALKLAQDPEVAARIAELQAEIAHDMVADRAYVMNRLVTNVERCMVNGENYNPNAANRSLELIGKQLGMFVDRRMLGVQRIEDMTEEEILEFLGGEPTPEELRAAAGTPSVGHA